MPSLAEFLPQNPQKVLKPEDSELLVICWGRGMVHLRLSTIDYRRSSDTLVNYISWLLQGCASQSCPGEGVSCLKGGPPRTG